MTEAGFSIFQDSLCIGQDGSFQFATAHRAGCRTIFKQDDLRPCLGRRCTADFDHRHQYCRLVALQRLGQAD